MPLAYDIGIRGYQLALYLAATVHPKARRWVEGRQGWRVALEQAMLGLPQPLHGRLWMHCASVGEFEQGRPLIEALKRAQPDLQVVLTFYSPSGYGLRKDYPLADHVGYLPLDTATNAVDFLDRVRPSLVLFVKYEFWFHFLKELKQRDIPLFLVSGIFREGQWFFRPWGRLFRRMLDAFQYFFLQDEASAVLLRGIGLTNQQVTGDTRVDRVAAIAEESPRDPLIEAFAGQAPVMVAGSTWPPDERLLARLRATAWAPPAKILLAPHEIDAGHLAGLQAAFGADTLRYSEATEATARKADLLIIDNVGMLAGLYRYGTLAYVGGGFGAGIHNILEPVAFGLPVLFGPRHHKFREARQLIEAGAAFPIEDGDGLIEAVRVLRVEAAHRRAAHASRAYIAANRGATEAVLRHLIEGGFLPVD